MTRTSTLAPLLVFGRTMTCMKSIPPALLATALLLATPEAGAQQAPPPAKHRSVPMMITGIVFASVGAALFATGGVGVAVGCQHTACGEGGGFIIPAVILWT